MIKSAYDSGADSVAIPPGDYRFNKQIPGLNGVWAAFRLENFQRPANHPFRIIATGVTFWFDFPDLP